MRTRKRPGQTLIEVTIAALIAAMTATAVFSVVLSSYGSEPRADKRDAAAMVLRRAQATLGSYVSLDPYNPNLLPGLLPEMPAAPGSPIGRWAADTTGVWALCARAHDISSLVAGPPLSMPGYPPATLTYTVADYDCGFGLGPPPHFQYACKRVVFTLNYTD